MREPTTGKQNNNANSSAKRAPELLQQRQFVGGKMGSIGHAQEAWCNRTWSEIVVPAGLDIREYCEALNNAVIYSGLKFYIKEGKLIEESVYSIGD